MDAQQARVKEIHSYHVYWRGEIPGVGSTPLIQKSLVQSTSSSSSSVPNSFFPVHNHDLVPLSLPYGSIPIQVVAGRTFGLILTQNGQVFSFGTGRQGELGLGDSLLSTNKPTRIYFPLKKRLLTVSTNETRTPHEAKIRKIAAGPASAGAISESGQVFIWGCLGHAVHYRPFIVSLPNRCLHLALGAQHGVAVMQRVITTSLPAPPPRSSTTQSSIRVSVHSIFTWGSNRSMQLGREPATDEFLPNPSEVVLPEDSDIAQIECGAESTAVLTTSGSVWWWGRISSSEIRSAPELIAKKGITAIGSGTYYIVMLDENQKLMRYDGSAPAVAVSKFPGNKMFCSGNTAIVLFNGGSVLNCSTKTKREEENLVDEVTDGKRIIEIALASKFQLLLLSCPQFGYSSIEEIVRWNSLEAHPAPVLQVLVEHLRTHIDIMGIFRESGSGEEGNELQHIINCGLESVVDLSAFSPLSVANFLKRFLRFLPVPLISMPDQTLMNSVVDHHAELSTKVKKERLSPGALATLEKIQDHLANLAPDNRLSLHYVVSFLDQVARRHNKNRMGSQNLGLMFGPGFFGKNIGMGMIESCNMLTSCLIINHQILFSPKTFPLVYSSLVNGDYCENSHMLPLSLEFVLQHFLSANVPTANLEEELKKHEIRPENIQRFIKACTMLVGFTRGFPLNSNFMDYFRPWAYSQLFLASGASICLSVSSNSSEEEDLSTYLDNLTMEEESVASAFSCFTSDVAVIELLKVVLNQKTDRENSPSIPNLLEVFQQFISLAFSIVSSISNRISRTVDEMTKRDLIAHSQHVAQQVERFLDQIYRPLKVKIQSKPELKPILQRIEASASNVIQVSSRFS